jgi:hypothetical protein
VSSPTEALVVTPPVRFPWKLAVVLRRAHPRVPSNKIESHIELTLLQRAYRLAVKKKRLSSRSVPDIELPPLDPAAVRKGIFRRAEVEKLCEHLDETLADVVQFLFFCPWRVG